MESQRKAYLDNIRWTTVLLVLIYHVGYLFNDVGIPGGIPNAANLPGVDVFCCVVYPWFMVLLFVVAGMSARYSLQKRSIGQFLRERVTRLLVPSTLGLLVLHWITGYLNLRISGGLAYIPAPLVYPIAVMSGIGPLWFIQTLFLFSCALALIQKLDRRNRLWQLGGRAGLPVVLLLFLVLWGAAQILNAPVLTVYRFGIYFAAFLIGYFILSHDAIQQTLARTAIPLIALGVVGAVAYALYYYGQNFTADACLKSRVTALYLWVVVLAILGGFRRFADRETPLTRYLSRASYGLYILHYPLLLAVCYGLQTYGSLPAGWNYLLALLAECLLTPVLYEGIRRVPILRFWVLGIRKGDRK